MRRTGCFILHVISTRYFSFPAGLDFGSDVYLIQNGEIQSILKNAKGFHDLIKPLKHSINEIQFTWRSGSRPLPSPLVGRHLFSTVYGLIKYILENRTPSLKTYIVE